MPTAGMASRHDRTGHLPAGAEARLTTHGAQVPVGLPGGTDKTASDPRFSDWRGSFATFELYSNHEATDSIGAFEKIWATGDKD